MSTQAIDVTTIFFALYKLEKKFLGTDRQWSTLDQEQAIVFELYRRNQDLLNGLKAIKAEASTNWQVLNRFLTDNGFDKMFHHQLNGIGAVSILDMLVEWFGQANLCNIYGRDRQNYVGFEIPQVGRDVFYVEGVQVARLKTKSGDSLWLTMPEKKPSDLIDLLRIAFTTMTKKQGDASDHLVTRIKVPEVDFNIKPDIGFLTGVSTHDKTGQYWYISQAYQQFKLRINKEGARVKVASGTAMRGGIDITDKPKPLIFDRPFVGWFTQTTAPRLPIAVFYADYDSWQETGDLR